MRVLAPLAIAVLVLSSSLLLASPATATMPFRADPSPAVTGHAPILITSNAGFTAANGVVSGSGTPADPYVISGWTISSASGDGISIQNTNASFVVRDVILVNGTAYNAAVSFGNVSSGAIENSTFLNGWTYGAILTGVSDVRMSNSYFQGIGSNVNLLDASNVTIFNNTFAAGSTVGISANFTTDAVFENNTVWGASIGIAVGYGGRVAVLGNTIGGSGTGISFFSSTGNIANDHLLGDGDGVALSHASNVTVTGNLVSSSTGTGISLFRSTGVLVYHNALWNNGLQASDDLGPQNAWDNGYPSSGNFWSNYTGVDQCSGPLQNTCTGADGIGDTPYLLDANSTDRYPLMSPNGTGAPPPAANFTLYGAAVSGWGFTPSTMTTPGPTLNVSVGDPVTLHLVSQDGITHSWFLDLNNNDIPDAGEPASPLFNGSAPINFTFTPTQVGTFAYRCALHPSTMWGSMVVEALAPHTQLALFGTTGLNGWYVSAVNVTLTASGPGAGPWSTFYRVNGSAWVPYTAAFQLRDSGANLLEYYSTDLAGNDEAIQSATIKVDLLGPVLRFSLAGNLTPSGWYNTPVTWSFDPVTSVAPPVDVRCAVDGIIYDRCASSGEIFDDGVHSFGYSGTDAAGVSTAQVGFPIRIDRQAPVSILEVMGTAGTGTWYTSNVTGVVTATDAMSGVAGSEVRIDNGSWRSTTVFNLSDGVHMVWYRSVDLAGNWEDLRGRPIFVDAQGPTFGVVTPFGIVTSSSVTVTWTAWDLLSGIARYGISVDGGSPSALGTATSVTLSLADGDHTIVVTAISVAGSASTETIRFRVDTNPLSATGPLGTAVPIAAVVIAAVAVSVLVWDLVFRRRPRSPDPKRGPDEPGEETRKT